VKGLGPFLGFLLLAFSAGDASGAQQGEGAPMRARSGAPAVVASQADGTFIVEAVGYRAVIGADGNLHSFRVGDAEMLDDRIAISLGSFFYADGPRTLQKITLRGPAVVEATDGAYMARYRFLPDEIQVVLSNSGDKPVSYLVVLSPQITIASNVRTGEAAAAAANEQWDEVRFSTGSGAYLQLSGGNRIWGPWLGRQVWEVSQISPGGRRELRFRGGIGDPPKATLEQLVGVRAKVSSDEALVPAGSPIELQVSVDNRSDRTLKGLLSIELGACRGEVVIYSSLPVELLPRQVTARVFRWDVTAPDIYSARVTALAGEREVARTTAGAGYRVTEILPNATRPSDFWEFWQRLLKEVGDDPPEFRMVRDRRRSRPGVAVWVVQYESIGGKTIQGWYLLPEQARPLPAILYLSGYGARPIEPPLQLASHGYIVLAVDVRGNRVDRVRPRPFEDYCREGIESPETYVYREIVGHALRAVNFLCAREETDRERIAVVGVSEGGGVGLLLGALSPAVRAVAADAPMLCDFPLSLRCAAWPYTQIARHLQQHPELTPRVMETLSYFDAVNFAPEMKCPILLSVGFLDRVSLPAAVYGFYNLVPGRKEIRGFPEAGHEGGGHDHWAYKLRWLAETLGATPSS
jgi:cephalosporin-C deacetylase